MTRKILVTGASGGFGSLACRTLLGKGHAVVGTMRDPDGRHRDASRALADAGGRVVAMDVTDDASVQHAVAEAQVALGGLDVVVNNAGTGVHGYQESFTPADWQRVFDVNVFGVQRVNRAALPDMRERGSGLLIHVSSLLGRFVLPFLGPYNASKWALEALAENYRVELAGVGVDSVVVEPGAFATPFHEAVLRPSDTGRTATYGDRAGAPDAMMEAFSQNLQGERAPRPQLVADAVARLVDTPPGERPFRTIVDELGMGTPIEGLNRASEEVTTGLYGAFGMAEMLRLRTGS